MSDEMNPSEATPVVESALDLNNEEQTTIIENATAPEIIAETNAIETESPIVKEEETSVVEETPVPVIIAEIESFNETAVEITDDEQELAVVEELPDYTNLNKNELLKTALTAAKDKEVNEALNILKAVKPFLEAALHEEQAKALEKFIEEGGEKDDFEYKADESIKEQFNKAFNELKDKKAAQRAIYEAEKIKNLKAKEAILEEIKKLNDAEETKDSLKKLKELQGEWKKIKNVPKEYADSLWESYRVLNEIFYDKLSINIELKQLDRERNLDHKIELCKKVSELLNEKSIKTALIAVKKYQEEWRNIGPVPKEANDDIWARFKAEADKVFALIREETEKNEAIRRENLEKKKVLIEKAKTLSEFSSEKIKEWLAKTKDANDLMEEWKKIGMVPMALRDKIWDDFRNARNSFFNQKNAYFKVFNAERNENMKRKTALCEKAEVIANTPMDWIRQTNDIKAFQEEWKKIGPVPDKFNDTIWKRFRGACDSFFAKKAERFASQAEEQNKNLEFKRELISKLETLAGQEEENPNVFTELKAIQESWNDIGYVPMKEKDAIAKTYNNLMDKIYNRYRELKKNMRESDEKSQLEAMAATPNGAARLYKEEKILMERIRGMKADIDTWENNIGFFKNGNSKNPLAEQMQDKINIGQKHLKGLEEKLKLIRSYKVNKIEN